MGEGLRRFFNFCRGPCGQQIFRDKTKWERDLEGILISAVVLVVNIFSETRQSGTGTDKVFQFLLWSMWLTNFQRQDKGGMILRRILKFSCGPCGQQIFRDKTKWERNF